MQGTGKTYAYSGNTTEWEDILIKKGITTKEDVLLSKGLNPDDFIKKEEPILEEEVSRIDRLHELDLDDLDELEDDSEFSDTRILDAYRQLRINELKEAAFKNRFGEVVDIVKNDWIREVTESSKTCIVIVHLYEDSIIECEIMDEALKVLAPKFKYLKFLRIKSTHAIENWPERNLPALFIYIDGIMQSQLITLQQLYSKSMKPYDLEWFLVKKNIITDSELEEDPRKEHSTSNSSLKITSSNTIFHTKYDSDEDYND